MQELLEYRHRLLDRFGAALGEFRRRCESITDPKQPLEPGGWNAHQIAVHTRDTDRQVYGMRLRRTIEEHDPLFPNFDGEAWMLAQYDARETLASILDELTLSVKGQLDLLRALPSAAWARTSRHETLGSGLTLQTWVERGLAHLQEHLASLAPAANPGAFPGV
jgi:hypothetical protein